MNVIYPLCSPLKCADIFMQSRYIFIIIQMECHVIFVLKNKVKILSKFTDNNLKQIYKFYKNFNKYAKKKFK